MPNIAQQAKKKAVPELSKNRETMDTSSSNKLSELSGNNAAMDASSYNMEISEINAAADNSSSNATPGLSEKKKARMSLMETLSIDPFRGLTVGKVM